MIRFKSRISSIKIILVINMFLLANVSALYCNPNPTKDKYVVSSAEFEKFRGVVHTATSKKAMKYVSITIENTGIGTITNSKGGFLLKVPTKYLDGFALFSHIGFKTKRIPLEELKRTDNEVFLEPLTTHLDEVEVLNMDPRQLVSKVLKNKGDTYLQSPTIMTAFYRETIKKRKRNVSLSEAIVDIYKKPYSTDVRDLIDLKKHRKSTDYKRLDTIALKLGGGPFNTLFGDIIKYPKYVFPDFDLGNYDFQFDENEAIEDPNIVVIKFWQKEHIQNPLFKGKLFVNPEQNILKLAIYSLNLKDNNKVSGRFVKSKPSNVKVRPKNASYRVEYKEANGKWYYNYSNMELSFVVNWDKRLFSSVYSVSAEMAVTDLNGYTRSSLPKPNSRLKSSVILTDREVGFNDSNFWGKYNIIEPEKSIDTAIKKIQKQLEHMKIGRPTNSSP